MTKEEIEPYIDGRSYSIRSQKNMAHRGRFIPEDQEEELKAKNEWVLQVGNDQTILKGDLIISIIN